MTRTTPCARAPWTGFIRHELGQRMELRALPQLKFTLDTSIEYSAHIAKIIESLHSQDKKSDE